MPIVGWCDRCGERSSKLEPYPTLIGALFCPKCMAAGKKRDGID